MEAWITVYAPKLIPILVSAFIVDRHIDSWDEYMKDIKSYVFHPRLVKGSDEVWRISDFLLLPSNEIEKGALKVQVNKHKESLHYRLGLILYFRKLLFDNRPNAAFLPNPEETNDDIGIVVLRLPPKFNDISTYKSLWDNRTQHESPLKIMSSFNHMVLLKSHFVSQIKSVSLITTSIDSFITQNRYHQPSIGVESYILPSNKLMQFDHKLVLSKWLVDHPIKSCRDRFAFTTGGECNNHRCRFQISNVVV
jgi:hypothetical protein